MNTQDRAALNDLLRLLDAPVSTLGAEGARLRWASPTALALLLARWTTIGGSQRSLWVDAPSEAEAQTLAHDLAVLLPDARVAHFPGFAPFAGGESSPPGVVLKERLANGRTLTVVATSPDGSEKRLHAMVRIDTPQEIEYFEHGGILQYVLRQLAAK